MSGFARALYAGAGVQVTQAERGRCTLLRFTGACTPELVQWLPQALRAFKHAVAVNARGLESIEAPFVQKILDRAAKKQPVALVDPPDSVLRILQQFTAMDRIPIFSADASILESGSLADSAAEEQLALSEIESRFRINPLWRRVDQQEGWLCALCGLEVEDVHFRSAQTPGAVMLRRVRRHLLEDCMAWRSGRHQPLPASVLDAFLAEVNLRKAGEDAERKKRLSQELETLQLRVVSMQEIERSVDQAMRRQLHLLPIDPPPDPAADIAVVYRPLQAVSGDFLDFYPLEGGCFGVAVGDVSGHGVETAIIMGMAKMAFRVRSQSLGSVREIVTRANQDLFTELRRTAFVTGVFALIDRTTRRMTYARAGHTRPLVRRAAGGCEELEGQGLPFGVDPGPRFEAGLEERFVDLAPGDVVLLYTDGVIEAGPPNAQFGPDRLRDALLAAPVEGTAREILDSIVRAVDGFLAGAAFGDDVTLICLKIR